MIRCAAVLTVVLAASAAAADPLPGEGPAATPTADELAAAPRADEASGVVVARKRSTHPIANALLIVPRAIVVLLLTPTRYAGMEVDNYLQSRSPNAFGRDTKSAWRFRAIGEWEKVLGPSLGVAVERLFAPHSSAAVQVGLFGARGESAAVTAQLGEYTALQLSPVISVDAGRALARGFRGIAGDDLLMGDGSLATYDDQQLGAGFALAARYGQLAITPRIDARASSPRGAGDHPITTHYDPAALRGFDEEVRTTSGAITLALDNRHPAHRWIPTAAPSSGHRIAATVGYERGHGERTHDFSTGRLAVEARQLLDLFGGDRVLTLEVGGEALSANAEDVPFDHLPTLGGTEHLQALVRGELRARTAAWAEVEYAWAISAPGRAYLFAEAGEVAARPLDYSTHALHEDFGAGIRVLAGAATTLAMQIAASPQGDVGFYLRLGTL